jgi:hypothetical protein
MVLLRSRMLTELDPPITHREENAWARACKTPTTQVSALANGLVEWTRMQRWIGVYGKHPRVVAWLKKHPPPALWQETPEAYAFTEMPFAPGWWKIGKGGT